MTDFPLPELASLAGVTPRTVRYYIAQGLLPAPGGAGRGARYGNAHLARLRLIRALQAEHLPLAEIRARLSTVSADDLRAHSTRPQATVHARASESAVDYIRQVLTASAAAPSSARHSTATTAFATPAPTPIDEPDETLPETSAPLERSQWDRLALAPDVELHVRRPLSRSLNKKVERLIAIGRQLLEEDQS